MKPINSNKIIRVYLAILLFLNIQFLLVDSFKIKNKLKQIKQDIKAAEGMLDDPATWKFPPETEVPYIYFHIEESNRDPLDSVRYLSEFEKDVDRDASRDKQEAEFDHRMRNILQHQNTNMGSITALEHTSSNILNKLYSDYNRDDYKPVKNKNKSKK